MAARGMNPSADVAIDEVLTSCGFRDSDARQQARAALERAGLTNPSKKRISGSKVGRVREILAEAFVISCSAPDCRSAASAARPTVVLMQAAGPSDCTQCRGSTNARAAAKFLQGCAAKRVRRVVLVGGSPSIRQELEGLVRQSIELRAVDGTGRRTKEQARADLEWADLVLIAGGSELKHRMSNHYTDHAGPDRRKVLQINKRGIAALLDYASEHLTRATR